MVVVHKEKAFPHQGEVAQVAALAGRLGGHCAMTCLAWSQGEHLLR